MKQFSLKTFTIVLFLACQSVFSQHIDCATPNDSFPTILLSPECSTTDNYIPGNESPNHRPIIYIRVNIHFFQRLDGSRNFTETGDGMGGSYNGYQYAQNLINHLNAHFSVNEVMKCAPNSPPPAVYPTQVRFVLWSNPSIPGDQGVYFHRVPDSVYSSHDYSWANNFGNGFFGSFTNYKNTYSVNGDKVLDIYLENSLDTNNLIMIEGNANKFKTYRGVAPYYINQIKVTSTYNQYKYDGRDAWSAAGITAHELGHSFGLKHSNLDQCNDEVSENLTGIWDSCNNIMSYNNRQRAWTPCQLGIIHAYFNNSAPNYIDRSVYCTNNPDSTIVIQSGQHIVWNSSRSLISDVIIEPNASLTIKCKIRMPASSKIIVKQKGKLIVDDGHITNACDGTMWRGIEVWGTYTQHQTPVSNPTYQGKVELKNGAIIENAIEGVTLMKEGDYNTTGGILIANGAKFINNRKAVAFLSYHNFNPTTLAPSSNVSYFTNTEFIINDDYIGQYNPNDFRNHVSLWDVEGINFKGCTFEDRRSSVSYNATEGYQCGIYSLDAGFNINTLCTNPNVMPCPTANILRSSFKGFTFGVRATSSSSSTKTVYITSADFDDNLTGLSISKVNNPVISNNNFSIGGSNISDYIINQPHIGLWTSYSSGYIIQSNAFTKDALSASPLNKGVYIDNSGPTNNRIFKNTFTNMNVAQHALNNNRGNGTGLEFICNTNIGSLNVDMYITGNGIKQNQGSATLSAGNTFSSGAFHISNGGAPINYYHHGGTSEPILISGSVSKFLAPSNSCSSGSGGNVPFFPFALGSTTGLTLQNELNSVQTTLANLEYNYNQLIDGGNTSALLEEIQNSWPAEAWQIRASLMSYSPYLSEDALKEAAFSGVLPQAMLLEICLANPDATKSDAFLHALQYEIENPLPEYMIQLIQANWELETPRTILESNISFYKGEKDVLINQFIANEMLQEERSISAIRSLWLDRNTISDAYALIDSYVDENEFSTASNLLNNIPENVEWSEILQEEHLQYNQYLNFREAWYNAGKTMAQLNEEEVQELFAFAVAAKGTSASVRAFNILCFFYHICEEIEPTNNEQGYETKKLPPAQSAAELIKNAYNQIQVFPNPANTYTTFSWKLPLLQNKAVLSISDVTGKIILQYTITTSEGQWIWDTRTISSGVYFYDIKDASGSLSSGKVLVKN